MMYMQQVGKPVTGQDFIGREEELALLMEYMKMGQSVVLIAPRRFGKTSLVLEALSRLTEQGYYTAFVNVFTNPILDLLSSAITENVLKNHKLHRQFISAKNTKRKWYAPMMSLAISSNSIPKATLSSYSDRKYNIMSIVPIYFQEAMNRSCKICI